jgi:hypothetical protein
VLLVGGSMRGASVGCGVWSEVSEVVSEDVLVRVRVNF